MKHTLVFGCSMVLALIVMDTNQVVENLIGTNREGGTSTRGRYAAAAADGRPGASRQGQSPRHWQGQRASRDQGLTRLLLLFETPSFVRTLSIR